MTEMINGAENGAPTSDDDLLQRLAVLQAERRELTAELDGLRQQVDTLPQELARCQADRNAAMVERDALQLQLVELRTLHDGQKNNIAMYQEQEARYQRTINRKDDEMDAFRGEVVRVASEAADEHGWCSVIDDMLRELGLERVHPSYTAELTITVNFAATRTDSRDTPDRGWVRDSIRRDDLEQVIHQHFAMDSDNENVEITDVSFSIGDVEENN